MRLELIPFVLQGALMLWDEFFFHRARGLPRWERIGHPVDTLGFGLCLVIAVFLAPTAENLLIYLGAAVLSCLLVTKDEWVHARLCPPAEHWLHAVLFILHPVCLGVVAWLWSRREEAFFLRAELGLLFVFLIYQIVYWSWLWKEPKAHAHPSSITTSTTRWESAGMSRRTIP